MDIEFDFNWILDNQKIEKSSIKRHNEFSGPRTEQKPRE
jgi:hypothetical protein